MEFTPSEVWFAENFAGRIVENIDQRNFYSVKEAARSVEKIFQDNARGKLAEILVYNIIQTGQMDFNIYEKGKGDDFDIWIEENFRIDVKASSHRANFIMVELERASAWKRLKVSPDYFCMVAIHKCKGEYMFGCDVETFRKNCQLVKSGDVIPGTNVTMSGNNYIVHKDVCSDEFDLINKIAKVLDK